MAVTEIYNPKGLWDHLVDVEKSQPGDPSVLVGHIERVFMNLGEHYRILDIGCGFGRIPDLITRGLFGDVETHQYLGVDCSPRMIAAAKELHPEFEFREGVLGELDKSAPEKFDGFLMINVLNSTPREGLASYMDDVRGRMKLGAVGAVFNRFGTEAQVHPARDFAELFGIDRELIPAELELPYNEYEPEEIMGHAISSGFELLDLTGCDGGCHFCLILRAI